MGARDIERCSTSQSGLLGVSGISGDMRALEASTARRATGHRSLRLAPRLVRRRLAAALGGLDGIVFTAGIGEHSASLRRSVCRAAAWIGVTLDDEANASGVSRISTPGSRVSAWTVPTDEELMIARHTKRILISQSQAKTQEQSV